MKAINFSCLLLVMGLCSTSTLANSTFKSKVTYLNPNGCRVFTMVVDPDCPYEYAPTLCQESKEALKKIAAENPTLGIQTKCSEVHTGSGAARLLAEMMMQSPSYDGFANHLTINGQGKGTHFTINSALGNETSCHLVAEALATLNQDGLDAKVECIGSKLEAQFQF